LGGAAVWTLVVIFGVIIVAACFLLVKSRDADQRTPPRAAARDVDPAETSPAAATPPTTTPATEAEPAPVQPADPGKATTTAARKRAALTPVDRRLANAGQGSATQRAAVERLRRTLPGVDVEFDPITGAPKQVMAAGQFLSASGGDVDGAVGKFIDAHPDLFGHTAAALGHTKVTRNDVTAHNGMTTRVWQQELDGVPLYKTILKANLTKRGELVALGSHFVADPATAAGQPAATRAALIAHPPVDASQAVARAAADLGTPVAPEQTEVLTCAGRGGTSAVHEGAGPQRHQCGALLAADGCGFPPAGLGCDADEPETWADVPRRGGCADGRGACAHFANR
jgi:hypothetical protein